MLAAGYIDKNQETEAAEVDMTSQLHDKYEGKSQITAILLTLMRWLTKPFPSII